MTNEHLMEILRLHTLWLRGKTGGARANLSGANLSRANLSGLEVPVIDRIDQKISSAVTAGALEMSTWHTCETTHCVAGWAIHLAGDAGAKLEQRVGPSAAGALIYAASGSHPVPSFYASNEVAMDELRRRAAASAPAESEAGE